MQDSIHCQNLVLVTTQRKQYRIAQQAADVSQQARHATHSGRKSTRPVVTLAVDSVYRDMRTSVDARLDELDGRLTAAGGAEITRLVTALRELLAEHEPDASGRCRTCRKGWLRRKSHTPCRGFLAAYLSLVLSGHEADDDDPSAGLAPPPRKERDPAPAS